MAALNYLASFIFVLALIGVGGWLLKTFLLGDNRPSVGLFKAKGKRLSVVDQAMIDGRRKLLLIRRDNVEHLVMTGGPSDIVIETGIKAIKEDASSGDPAPSTLQITDEAEQVDDQT